MRISTQSQKVYELLLNEGGMDAKQIGLRLRVFPQAVYREVERLARLGMVEVLDKYPKVYKARPQIEAADFYLDKEKEWFVSRFGKGITESTSVKLIKTREESIELFTQDLGKAKSEICLLVSGDEVPVEQILAFKEALERGVQVRILVQDKDIVRSGLLATWDKLGVEVRATSPLGLRLLLIDKQVAYLLSFDSKKKQGAAGVRFAYAPIANFLRKLFDEQWVTGEELKV